MTILDFIESIDQRPYDHSDEKTKILLQLLDLSNPDLRLSSGNCLLHTCAKRGFYKCILFLIDKGANVNVKNKLGKTPLLLSFIHHYSVELDNSKKCINLLLDAGADVNIKDEYGETPLSRAIAYGDDDSTKLFILNGGDIFQKHGQDTAVDLVGGLLSLREILGEQFSSVIDKQLKLRLRVF